MTHREGIASTELQALLIGLEEHQVAMAKRGRCDLDQDLIWLDRRDLAGSSITARVLLELPSMTYWDLIDLSLAGLGIELCCLLFRW